MNSVIEDIEHDPDKVGVDSDDDVDSDVDDDVDCDVSCSACCSGDVDHQRLIHDNLLVSKTRAPGTDPADKVNAPPYSKDEFHIVLQHLNISFHEKSFHSIVTSGNRDSWHNFYTTAGCDKSQLCSLVFRESEPSGFYTFMTGQTK